MRNTTLAVALLELAAIAVLARLAPTFQPGLIGMALLVLAGMAAWRWVPREIVPDDYDTETPAQQLARWCDAIGIGTPEIKRHEYTDTGEMYWLKVAGYDEQGYVMTPEQFHGYWRKFRAVAGDGCRGVFISPPDHRHGGRCTMTVVWDEAEPDDNPWPVPVLLSSHSVRMCYSHEEVAAAHAEAERNGFVDVDPVWLAPNPRELAGEG